jgi:hypothetical protein
MENRSPSFTTTKSRVEVPVSVPVNDELEDRPFVGLAARPSCCKPILNTFPLVRTKVSQRIFTTHSACREEALILPIPI